MYSTVPSLAFVDLETNYNIYEREIRVFVVVYKCPRNSGPHACNTA